MPEGNPSLRSIFVSYRREDSAAYAGRICDHLEALFGEDRIFIDVEDIRPGQNFAQTLDQRIADCTAFLAIIGPKWTEVLQERAKENQKDYVCHEIEAALAHKTTIIPVLVGGATMTQLTGLPECLAELPLHQAAEIRDGTFKEDCNRLANVLRESAGIDGQSSGKTGARKKRTVWIAAAVALTAALLLTLVIGLIPWRKYHARQVHLQEILNTAQAQTDLGEYESAFKTYKDAVEADPANRTVMDRQADAAMLCLREFHVLIGDGQNATDLAGPPLAAMISVLDAALSRTNGHGPRAADIMAHLGWAHWLNWHIAQKEFRPAAEQDFRRSLALDPMNVYGNAMLGNWLLQTSGNVDEAVCHFEVAERSNKERRWVRQMQLAGMADNDDTQQQLIRAVNQMRINAEPISASDRHRVLSNYSLSNTIEELRKTLSAIPADDAWATFTWLDDNQEQARDQKGQRIQREFIHAIILDLGGRRPDALAIFLDLQRQLRSEDYSTRITSYVDSMVKRLSAPSQS
jgi:tetratricopeptide (TPR) repeat protein